MRKLLTIPLLLLSLIVSGATYYVSTTGNDSSADPTNIATPWLTWKKAFATAQAGDTVYFRGGTYEITDKVNLCIAVYSGTAGNPICYFNYPGEVPVLDCNDLIPNNYGNVIRVYSNKNYLNFRGLTFGNLSSTTGYYCVYGLYIESCHDIHIENCVGYNIDGYAFTAYSADEVYFKNCDAYGNSDEWGSPMPGNNGTGFTCSTIALINARIYYENCRAWQNSDNGFSGAGIGYHEYKNCWAFSNGELQAEGTGFKMSWAANQSAVNDTSRYIINCIAACNGLVGFSPNSNTNGYNYLVHNNLSYHNGYRNHPGVRFISWAGVGTLLGYSYISSGNEWYRNNIAYANEYANWYELKATNHEYNSWDQSVIVTDEDFVSLDTAQLYDDRTGSRDTVWGLPVITFGKLASSSDLVGAGINVGLTTDGQDSIWLDPPSLGAFEYYEQLPAVVPTLATLATHHPYWLTTTTASTGGFVSDDGGADVTARGVCWNTTGTPTTANSKTSDGTGDGAFTSTMTGLTQGTTYYVRAYATNEAGTAYGSQMTFRTQIIKHLTKSVIKHAGLFIIMNPAITNPTPFTGTTYYVKTGGDDTKSGLTDEDAWAHHPWMSTWTGSTVLVAGDVVSMKRGDTWSSSAGSSYLTVAQSGSAGKPITTTAYGTGADPIIKISADVSYPVIEILGKSYLAFDNLKINHFEGTQDASHDQDGIIFGKDASLNLPHDIVITNCEFSNIPDHGIHGVDDSYNITIGDINATQTATNTQYSNYFHDCGYAAIGLRGRDTLSGHSHWDVYYNYIDTVDVTSAGVNSYGVYFSSNVLGDGQNESDGWPVYATARYNLVKNIPVWEGLDAHGGEYIYFQDNYVYNCGLGITAFPTISVNYPDPILNHCYVERNTIENSGDRYAGDYTFISCVGESTTERITNVHILDNTLFYTTRPANEAAAMGIYTRNADTVTISGNTIYNGPTGASRGGIRLSYPSSLVKNVTVSDNFVSRWGIGIYTSLNGVDGDIDINSNIVVTNTEGIYGSETTLGSGTINIYDNTVYNLSTGTLYAVCFLNSTIAGGAAIDIKNNIIGFTASTSNGYYILGPATITGTFTTDYNMFYNSTKASPFHYAGSARDWAYWTTTIDQELNSPNFAHGDASYDPTLINASGLYNTASDFALQVGSPAINAGANTGVTLDYYGNARVGNYDIGAIEKQ